MMELDIQRPHVLGFFRAPEHTQQLRRERKKTTQRLRHEKPVESGTDFKVREVEFTNLTSESKLRLPSKLLPKGTDLDDLIDEKAIISVEKALIYKSQNKYNILGQRNEYIEPAVFGDLGEISLNVGLGVKSFFLLYKVLAVAAFVMGVLSTVPIYYNFFGQNLEEVNIDANYVLNITTRLSLANNQLESQTIYYITTSFLSCTGLAFLVALSLFRRFNSKQKTRWITDFELCPIERFAVRVEGLRNESSEDVRRFFSRFGEVSDVFLVRDSNESYSRVKAFLELKQQASDLQKLVQQKVRNKAELKQAIGQAVEMNQLLGKVECGEIVFAVVVFQHQSSKTTCIQRFTEQGLLVGARYWFLRLIKWYQSSQKYLIGGDEIVLRTKVPNPAEINFQYLDIGSGKQFVVGLLTIVLLVCYTIAAALAMHFTINMRRPVCSSVVDLKSQVLPGSMEQRCYCWANADQLLSQPCRTFTQISGVVYETWVLLLVALLAFISQYVVALLTQLSARLIRFSLMSSALTYKLLLNSLFGVLVCVAVPIGVNANIFGRPPMNYFLYFLELLSGRTINLSSSSLFRDTGHAWIYQYSQYAMYFMLASLLQPLCALLRLGLALAFRVSMTIESHIPLRLTQQELNRAALYYKFNFELQLTEVVVSSAVVLFFGYAQPMLYGVYFAYLVAKYIVARYLVIRHSAVERGLAESLAIAASRLLMVLMFCSQILDTWIVTAVYRQYSSRIQFNILWLNISSLNRYSSAPHIWVVALPAAAVIMVDLLQWFFQCKSCFVDYEQVASEYQKKRRQNQIYSFDKCHAGMTRKVAELKLIR